MTDSFADIKLRFIRWRSYLGLSEVIWVSPKCNHRCPCKREAEADVTQKEEKVVWLLSRGESVWLWPTMLLCPWNTPGKNTGVGCHSFSRGSSWSRDWTLVSCIAGRFFTVWEIRKAQGWTWCSCTPRNAGSYQKLEEARNESSHRASRGSVVLPTSQFQTSGLQNCERIHFCCFKPRSLCNFLEQPQEINVLCNQDQYSNAIFIFKHQN